MSRGGTTSFWAEECELPPLNAAERIDGRDAEAWINQHLSFIGTAVDWSRVRGTHQHWSASDDDLSGVVDEFLAAAPGLGDVVHVGDSLSPYSVRIAHQQLRPVLVALLEIPEHHYLVACDRSWCGVFRMEGDVDIALLDASQ